MPRRSRTKLDITSSKDETKANAVSKKNPHAVALGRLGGKKGGKARAAALTAERRIAISKAAAASRWGDPEKRLDEKRNKFVVQKANSYLRKLRLKKTAPHRKRANQLARQQKAKGKERKQILYSLANVSEDEYSVDDTAAIHDVLCTHMNPEEASELLIEWQMEAFTA